MAEYKEKILIRSKQDDIMLLNDQGLKTVSEKKLQNVCKTIEKWKFRIVAALGVRDTYKKVYIL